VIGGNSEEMYSLVEIHFVFAAARELRTFTIVLIKENLKKKMRI